MYISGSQGETPVWQIRGKDVSEQCVRDGTPIPIIEIPVYSAVAAPDNHLDAVYVSHQRGELSALGYVSTKPIFDNHFRYDVDVTRLFAAPAVSNVERNVEETATGMAHIVLAVGLFLVLCNYTDHCSTITFGDSGDAP